MDTIKRVVVKRKKEKDKFKFKTRKTSLRKKNKKFDNNVMYYW